MPHTVSLVHFDTCLPDYVLNHMNGEREALLSVSVDAATTLREVKADLARQLRDDDFYGKTDLPSDEALLTALEDLFETTPNLDAVAAPDLDPCDEDDDMAESPSMWFRLSWDAA